MWAAIAQWGARLNLLNLAPVPMLDGKALGAFSQTQRWIVVAGTVAALAATQERTLWLVLIPAVVRALAKGSGVRWPAVVTFVLLVAALAALAAIGVRAS